MSHLPANNPYNGHSWSGKTGTVINEAQHRMSMVTAYATFAPSNEFRVLADDVLSGLMTEESFWSLTVEQRLQARRDAYLMTMGV